MSSLKKRQTKSTSEETKSQTSITKTTKPSKSEKWKDLILYLVMFIYVYVCPFTKVEESFNLQAMHDILYHGSKIENYDHIEFPGVIPRTFIGALIVSSLSSPFVYIVQYLNISKLVSLYIVRVVLGSIGVFSLTRLRRSISRQFGNDVGLAFVFILVSQFHLLFYISRPLPNVFAMALVVFGYSYWIDCQSSTRYKSGLTVVLFTIAIFVFRSEVLVLAGPVTLSMLIYKRLKWSTLIGVGVITAVLAVGMSVLIDSFFWQRTIWPELEVLMFNTVENRSSEWGISPFHWYFSSALPRALLIWLPFSFVSVIVDRRLIEYIAPTLLFVLLYSFLPHKELRFIFYVLPMLSFASAVTVSKIVQQFKKGFIYKLITLGVIGSFILNIMATAGFLYVSSLNYPGGVAFRALHSGVAQHCLYEQYNVHIDNLAAISGVSRFGEISPSWIYSKKERDVNLGDYDFLMAPNQTIGFKTIATIPGFSRINRLPRPPFVEVIDEPQIFIMASPNVYSKCKK